MDTSIVKIPDTYAADGYDFRLLERKGDVAIYEQWHRDPVKLVGYEVCVVRIRAAGEIKGQRFPASERLPSANDWGKLGWSFGCGLDQPAALKRARERSSIVFGLKSAKRPSLAPAAAHA